MTSSKRVTGTAVRMPIGIMWGTVLGLTVTGVLSAVLAWLVIRDVLSERTLGYSAMGIVLLSVIMGAWFTGVRIKRRWVLVSCVTGVVYYTILLLCTAIFFGGNYQGMGVTAAIVLLGSLLTGIIGKSRSKHTGRGYKKYRSC